MPPVSAPPEARDPAKAAFGQPAGLSVIAATELWDRISFHGMQALLVLYMVGQLFLPGHVEHIVGFSRLSGAIQSVTGPLSTRAMASQVFGLYVGLVYFAPVLGGLLGDRVLGRHRTVILGALLMTAGHFCMAFEPSFLLALALLVLGAGCFRGNLSPQVAALYAPDDRRRELGFQIYGAAVNLGAFIAPVASGFLGQAFGWRYGFGFAGFGMLIGLIIYLAGRARLPPDQPRFQATAPAPPLTGEARRRVLILAGLVPIQALFWVAQSQVWNMYNLWVKDHLQLRVGGFLVPVPWLQALDGLAPFILLPPVLAFWRWQARRGREPDLFAKIAIGCFIFGLGTLWLAGAGISTDASGRSPLWWAVVFHFLSNLGWLYFTPTANTLFSRLAPLSLTATLMGVNTLSIFLGSIVSGRLGGFYEVLSPAQFWGMHALIVGFAGVVFLVARPWLSPLLTEPQ